MQRVAWLSGGVSSFVCAYVGRPDRVIYIHVADQHPDTLRFIANCETALGMPVETIGDMDYRQSVDCVIERRRYVNGPSGAQCTTLLKKRVRQRWERLNCEGGLTYLWGYDVGERRRAERIARSSEWPCEFPLIERGLTKADCHALCAGLGVRRPAMYDLGYPNNNCVGCVKGGMGYWNKIREDFPEVFASRARREREVGHSCIKGVFLDELKPRVGRNSPIVPECSLACGLVKMEAEEEETGHDHI